MATLTVNEKRNFEFNEDPLYDDVPVIAADIIFEGAAVGELATAGTARPLVAGDVFLGFAVAKVDNALGAAGDKNVRVSKKGSVQLTVVGVVGIADLNATVYAIDDNAFTLTAGANTAIGKVGRFVSGTSVIVRFEAFQVQSL